METSYEPRIVNTDCQGVLRPAVGMIFPLTATGTDDHELFCFRVNFRVPWQASLLLRD